MSIIWRPISNVANSSNKPSLVQESNTITEDEAQIPPNSRKQIQRKNAKPSKLAIVSDVSQSENEGKSESQSESEGAKQAAKTQFTEGVLWRPSTSMHNSTVKTKPNRKRPARKLVSVAKANAKAITTQADDAVSPKVPCSNNSRRGKVIKPSQNLKQL